MLAILTQRYEKKKVISFLIQFKNEILHAVRCQNINSLTLSWIMKCLFLRNMEPLRLIYATKVFARSNKQIEKLGETAEFGKPA